MKKIVGILTAAAIATSVFAADVSASTKIKGALFSYDNAKTFTLLKEGNDSHDYANPNMTFSVSDDKAGATVKLTTDGATKNVAMTTQTIWFKPIDALKVTAGNFDVALNKEQIKWTDSVTGLGGNGALLSVAVEGFGLDVGFACNEANWFSKADGADNPTIADWFIKGAYSADFGTIGGFVEFNRSKRRTYAYHDDFFLGPEVAVGTKTTYKLDTDTGKIVANDPAVDKQRGCAWALKDGAITDILFGAGYRNNFDGIDLFVNFNGYMADKFEWVRPEVYAAGTFDALSFKAFVAPLIIVDSDAKDAYDNAYDAEIINDKSIQCEVIANVTYALDGFSVYGQFYDTNILGKKFVSTIELGASGSVSAMGWKTWLQIDTGKGADKDKVDISVPFELTFNF
jgi:hypothetical protein